MLIRQLEELHPYHARNVEYVVVWEGKGSLNPDDDAYLKQKSPVGRYHTTRPWQDWGVTVEVGEEGDDSLLGSQIEPVIVGRKCASCARIITGAAFTLGKLTCRQCTKARAKVATHDRHEAAGTEGDPAS